MVWKDWPMMIYENKQSSIIQTHVQALKVLAATLHNACLHGMAGQPCQSASLVFMLTLPSLIHTLRKRHWINVEIYVRFFEGG